MSAWDTKTSGVRERVNACRFTPHPEVFVIVQQARVT